MADAQTPAAPKKTRKPQGPRVAKPLYGLVSYTDEQGNAVRLDKQRLVIQIERDPAVIMEALENGAGNQTMVRLTLPAPAARAATPAAAS